MASTVTFNSTGGTEELECTDRTKYAQTNERRFLLWYKHCFATFKFGDRGENGRPCRMNGRKKHELVNVYR